MRCFLALELAKPVLDQIEQALRPLRAQVPARWVSIHKQHLTVVFLGEISGDALPGIAAAVERVARACRSFVLNVRGASGFPNTRRPRVLWLRLSGELERLHALKSALDRALEPLGIAPEQREYRPHLTVARARHVGGDSALSSCIAALNASNFGASEISHLSLFESRPGAEEYRVLSRHSLAEPGHEPVG